MDDRGKSRESYGRVSEITARIPLLALQLGGGLELLLRAPRGQHPLALSLFRPHSAEWADSTVPAAGAGRRLFQHLLPAIPGDALHAARHRRPISALGDCRNWHNERARSAARAGGDPWRRRCGCRAFSVR